MLTNTQNISTKTHVFQNVFSKPNYLYHKIKQIIKLEEFHSKKIDIYLKSITIIKPEKLAKSLSKISEAIIIVMGNE